MTVANKLEWQYVARMKKIGLLSFGHWTMTLGERPARA
jgi:hypothetical protein